MEQTHSGQAQPNEQSNHVCLAWKLFLKENWSTDGAISQEQRRIALMRKWASAEQSYRDDFAQRARSLPHTSVTQEHDYYGGIPEEKAQLTSLKMYPCIRTDFLEENDVNWEKIKFFLNLDEYLSPLAREELPPVFEDQCFKDLNLETYAEQFIFGKANFKLMGMTELGSPYCYYHILMIADVCTFRDGTLLHVDFNELGRPFSTQRYLAIDYFMPWTKHINSGYNLTEIEMNVFHGGGPHQAFDLRRPVVDILRDEMEARKVEVGDAKSYHTLAEEAVMVVNPSLLSG